MKKVLIVGLLMITHSIFAETIKFECKSPMVEGVHKFEASGIITFDNYSNAEGLVNLKIEKANEEQSIQIFEELKVNGYIRHYDAGQLTKEAFDQIVLKVDHSYLKNVNLSLDVKLPLMSNAITVDNFMFRSDCYTLRD
jgi:hypothetical protein